MKRVPSESAEALKVRWRNDGEDFHILWSARRALRLLDVSSGLTSVSIEGPSNLESPAATKTDAGVLVIDTAEYYGSRAQKNERVHYFQLKHSTTAATAPWTVSGLKDTLRGFGRRYKAIRKKKGPRWVADRVRFVFVTNKPIATAITHAVSQAKSTRATKGDSKVLLEKLRVAAGLKPAEFLSFVHCLQFEADQPSRFRQQLGLESEAKALFGQLDTSSVAKMRQLIQRKSLSDAARNNTIRRDDVLETLGYVEDELLPAPGKFDKNIRQIARIQEQAIAKAIIESAGPVVIHAAGGVGKSVIAQRLPNLMPPGSESVVFDGFANGGYRASRDKRHQHCRGLVHIANTLASRGLCNILLPLAGASEEVLLNAVRARLAQAVVAVRRKSPGAIVLIVLDAADNSVMAAQEHNEKAFPPDILSEAPPEGCRVVALARSHRLKLLRLEACVSRIALEPFSEAESKTHLTERFPSASSANVDRFHRLTAANPRIQANALSVAKNIQGLLSALGPSILTVDAQIRKQLDDALQKLTTEHRAEKSSIIALCRGLAVLPPLIPISTLARAAGLSDDAVTSFVSDFANGRPLLLADHSVQFRDEPVETWFRDTFSATKTDFTKMAAALEPMASRDSYTAAALPQILLGAGQYTKLLHLALRGPGFQGGTAFERREVSLRRTRHALKAAVSRNRVADVAMLMWKAGEEAIIDDRQSKFMLENSDWVAAFSRSDTIYEFIFRKRAWRLSPNGYNSCACMLALGSTTREEALRFLRLSRSWISDLARTHSERREVNLEFRHIAEAAYATYLLLGAEATADYLRGWTPKQVSLAAGKQIASRLISRGDFPSVLKLLSASGANLHLRLGLIDELNSAHACPPKGEIAYTLRLLDKERKEGLSDSGPNDGLGAPIVSLAEMAARTGVPRRQVLTTLGRFHPAHERLLGHWKGERSTFLRFAALESALKDRRLILDELVPSSLTNIIGTPAAEHNDDLRQFRTTYGDLAPWFELRAMAFAKGVQSRRLARELSSLASKLPADVSSRGTDHERRLVTNEIPLLWSDIIYWADLTPATTLPPLGSWVKSQPGLFTPTLTRLARAFARAGMNRPAIELADYAKKLLLGDPTDAGQTAESLLGLTGALYPYLRTEAASYYDLAVDHLGRFGDETYDRLFSLAAVAEKAGEHGTPCPAEAYRLSRAVEVLHSHNDHKFPWWEAAHAVAGLCSSSALAIASRWADRDRVPLGDSLAPMIRALLERRRLDPRLAAALHIFSRFWNIADNPSIFFDNADKAASQAILDLLVRDLEFEPGAERLKDLLSHATSAGLSSARLTERVAFESTTPNTTETDSPISLAHTRHRPPKVDWRRVFIGCDLASGMGVNTAVARFRKTSPIFEWEAFFDRMRSRLPPRKWPDHLHALAQSDLTSSLVLQALDRAERDWTSSQAVRLALRDVVQVVIKSRSLDLARGRWARDELSICSRLGEISDRAVSSLLCATLADHADSVTGSSWFYIAGEITQRGISAKASREVLAYALDQMEPLFQSDAGDGPWRPELRPPKRVEDAVAGFLFACLAAPAAETRWRAAHAVRRLCVFNCKRVLLELMRTCDTGAITPFSDHRLPFYTWNGRLYLMIALERAAAERPEAVRPLMKSLLSWALERERHILIRSFAAGAALSLTRNDVRLLSGELISRLKGVCASPLPLTAKPPAARVGWSHDFHTLRGVSFPYDFDRYWIGPLAEIFNLEGKAVAKQIANWVKTKWGSTHDGAWESDPRAKAGIFGNGSRTSTDHGSQPSVDRLSFYLTYHAMFCVAGEMLAKMPTTAHRRWPSDPDRWPTWLEGHRVTRRDNLWLSDGRSFAPLELRRWQRARPADSDRAWRWSVLAQDFDEVLGLSGRLRPVSIPVWGDWEVGRFSLREEVGVKSALVSPKTSLALLGSLQTAEDFTDFRIPHERDDYESDVPSFELTGWVAPPPETDRGLDRFDPFAEQMRWPPHGPGRLVRRLWRLRKNDDGRSWLYGERPVFTSAMWSIGGRRDEFSNSGFRVTSDRRFIRDVLKRLQKDLILEVTFRRDDGAKKETHEYRHDRYARFYVLRANGELHTMGRHRRLW